MKKFFSVLVLAIFLAVLVFPLATSAQIVAPECCRLRRGFPEINAACIAGIWVGSAAARVTPATYCPRAPRAVPGVAAVTEVDEWAMCCLFNTIYTAVDWVFTVLMAIVVIFVLIGGITILFAAGAPEKITSGRNFILYAFIGLFIAFLAKAAPAIIRIIIGI